MSPFVRTATALLAFALNASAAAPVFRNPQPLPVTGYGGTLLPGIFGGDAQRDLAVYDGFRVQILINNGTAPFTAVAATVPVEGAVDLIAGDVTGDGRSDLVATFYEAGTVRIHRGLGNGLFDGGTSFPTIAMPGELAIADFNGDGRADLFVATADAHPENPVVAVHLGQGNGAFGSAITSPVEDTPAYVKVLDANGDTKPDVAVSSFYGTYVHLGSGNGTFVQQDRVAIDRSIIETGDFNGDGDADLVLAADLGGSALVALGNGDGTFTDGPQYEVGGGARAVDVADLDGDGKLDLILASYAGTVTVRRGAGDGTFANVRFYATQQLNDLEVGDWDRDGIPDVVVSGTDWPRVQFIKGKAGGVLDTWRAYTLNAVDVRNGIVADMNGDGKPDVILRSERADDYHVQLSVMLNAGNGTLGAAVFTDLGEIEWNYGPSFQVGDVNGDGKQDAVVISSYLYELSGRTYLGRGDGTFDPPIGFAVEGGGEPRLADMDGDGVLDLLLGGNVLHGAGNGTFTPLTTWPSPVEAITDINGDGRPDLAGQGHPGVRIGLNDGNGGFTTVTIEESEYPGFGTLGDFTGDGKIDVLLRTYTGTRVRPGNGDGTFGSALDFEINPRIEGPVQAADFDGDGKLDLVSATSVYLGDGAGRFRSYAQAFAVGSWNVQLGDLDGNGSPDVVAFPEWGSIVPVYLTRLGAAPTLEASVAISSDTPQGQYATGITYTAEVEGVASLPVTGAIVFSDEDVPVVMRVLGELEISERILSPGAGTRTIAAAYSGDERYLPEIDSLEQSIAKAPTTVAAVSLKTPVQFPSEARVSVTLSALVDNFFLLPPRDYTFRLGNTVLPARKDPARADAYYVDGLPIGTHQVTVEYVGNANFEPSSTTFAQVVRNTDPGLVLSADPSSGVIAGTPVTLRGTLASGAVGSIEFLANGVLLGTVPIVDGLAQLTHTFSWGDYVLTARYPGSAQFADDTATIPLIVWAGSWGTRPQVEATAQGKMVTVRWSPVMGASSFTVHRRGTFAQPWQTVGTYPTYLGYVLPVEIPSNSAAQFAVTAHDVHGNSSAMSHPDLTTSAALPAPVTAGVTPVRALDFVRLRAAVETVRAFAGLPPGTYTDPDLAGRPIRTVHVTDLRAALSEARAAIAMPLGFSDPTLTAGVTRVRAVHVQQIREGVE